MNLFWSVRFWDMYGEGFYAKLEPSYWSIIASKRYWANDGKWYGE